MSKVDEGIHEKLRKVLALTTSPIEGEASAAAEMLQKLLTAHNLSIADLEKRGQAKPGLRKDEHDLGKAAFAWKLNLAEVIAEHYFCIGLVDRAAKTVSFVGRPENVEALQMLYGWVIDQIKRIATEERRNEFIRTNVHIDPLRWQVNFGLGAVQRLRQRLADLKAAQSADNAVTALVLSHAAELSDWLEEHYGYRRDGRKTKREQAWEAEQARIEALKETDIEAFYAERPWMRPERVAEREKETEAWRKKQEKNRKRRKGRNYDRPGPRIDWDKEEQASNARAAGQRRADDVNLQPFLDGPKDKTKLD